MKDLSILIVEDEPLYASKMEMQLDMLDLQHLGTVDNSQDALDILKEKTPDLLLMDINIDGDYDGVELAQIIRDQYDIPALFISSLKDDRTFRRAMRVQPIGFLIKPFDELQLKRMLEVYFSQVDHKEAVPTDTDAIQTDDLLIKKDGKLIKIQQEELLYLNADGRYTFIHTRKGRFHIRKPMSNIVEDFPNLTLLQSHRSYVVNTAAITEIDLDEYLVFLGEQSVPLSMRNKDEFLSRWQKL